MFLESTPKQLTAIQVKSWLESCRSHMNSAKNDFESVKSWLTSAVENTDYSEEDRAEVTTKLEELRSLAITLTE